VSGKYIMASGLCMLMVMGSSASAAVHQIQLVGVNLQYDAAKIEDPNPAGSSSLASATFFVDGVPVSTDATGVTLDLRIPDVFSIPAGGGTVYSAAGGYLDLDLGGGEYLSLTLKSVTVTYVPVFDTVRFVFAGSSSTIDDQNLPSGFYFVDPVSVSFSTQVSQLTTAGGYVTRFVSAGTGELQGVPEPATLGLLAFGALVILRRRRTA